MSELLKDWLGDGGKAVDNSTANLRSMACVMCPLNVAPNWWNLIENAKSKIAQTIRHQLEIKNEMLMRVPFEAHLHMCKACGCALPLKIHVPIEHIKEHLKPGDLEKLHPNCWIRRELKPVT